MVYNQAPQSLLRNKYVDLAPSNATTGNTAKVFHGPGLIKHIYFLTQQDMDGFDWKLTPSNRDEIKMSLYDTGDATVGNLISTDIVYEQVVPQGIPDGVLQEFIDELRTKFNAFIVWIDDNVIGDNRSCADHDVDGTYTGSLAQECEANNSGEQCRKLNRMICYFNWGLDAVIDSVAGKFYDGSQNCSNVANANDNETQESDYTSSLATECGTFGSTRSGCTKLNKMICSLNWALYQIKDTVLGKNDDCTTSTSATTWRDTGSGNCDGDCTAINDILCKITHGLTKVGFDISVGAGIDFSWHLFNDAISLSTLGLPTYVSWTVPTAHYIKQDSAPKKSYIAPRAGGNQAAQQFDFDNYNRNQGFQITFPEPGIYVNKGLVIKQNSDNTAEAGSLAPTHTNVIYQQATTGIDANTGAIIA